MRPREAEPQVVVPVRWAVVEAMGKSEGAISVAPTATPKNTKTARTLVKRVVGADVLILGELDPHPFPQVSRHVVQPKAVGLVSPYRGGASIVPIEVGIFG